MRVIGELPSLSVAISDSRLCDILSLVTSIPLPQGAPPPVDEDEDLYLVSIVDYDVIFLSETGAVTHFFMLSPLNSAGKGIMLFGLSIHHIHSFVHSSGQILLP